MPHYTRGKTDKQRGDGVFDKSIKALQMLNKVGYGMPDSDLRLDLVYNPSGAFYPPTKLRWSRILKSIKGGFWYWFPQLICHNQFAYFKVLDYLIASDNYEDYMYSLVEAYNPAAVESVMCTNTISVSWDGWLYDCDFNQMLDLKVASKVKHIKDYNDDVLNNRDIIISQHCYGCTAGAGSSYKGTVA